MRQVVTIKGNYAEFGNEEKVKLDNIILYIDKLDSMIRADYLLQMLLDYEHKPNWFAIHRKLNKYKNSIKLK